MKQPRRKANRNRSSNHPRNHNRQHLRRRLRPPRWGTIKQDKNKMRSQIAISIIALAQIFTPCAQAQSPDYRPPTSEEFGMALTERKPFHAEQCRYLKDMQNTAEQKIERWKKSDSANTELPENLDEIVEASKAKNIAIFIGYVGKCPDETSFNMS
jgi:hypothetical protein